MNKDLIEIVNEEPVAGTYLISKGFGVTHQAVKKIILKYKERFERVGERSLGEQIEVSNAGFEIRHKNEKKRQKRGQKDTQFLINKTQFMFLGTLLKNTDQVLEFKEKLIKAFEKMQKFLDKIKNQKQNHEWLEHRKLGKVDRLRETDALKRLSEYQKMNGSENWDKCYLSYSKMVNQELFDKEIIKTKGKKNLRDLVDSFSLQALRMADHIVMKTANEEIEKKTEYHQIFQICKGKIHHFSEYIGKITLDKLDQFKGDLRISTQI